MTALSKTKIISRKVEFKGWHSLETVTVQPQSLRHAGLAQPMSREVYCSGTCAVALLYLPETDQILLNEQFRVGVLLAGDDNPWLYECAAGMVDDGEDAETAVKREALEETGCPILDLEFIGKTYPSPGGSNEVHMLYCGRIDAAEAGHYGLEEEGEEIKTHLVAATEAIRMLDAGRITNAATVICLHWFARHHDRLRKKWGQKP
jgi:ADP-ribose pyrophosphatase